MSESQQKLDAQTNPIQIEQIPPQVKKCVIGENQNVELQKGNQKDPNNRDQREHSWNRTTNSTQELPSIVQDQNLSRGSYTYANISKMSLPKINRYKNHLETKEEDYKFQWRPPQGKYKLTNQKINNQRNKLQQDKKVDGELSHKSKEILANSPSQQKLQEDKKINERQENSAECIKERKQTIILQSQNKKKLDRQVVNIEIRRQIESLDLEKLQKETDIIEISQDYERNQSLFDKDLFSNISQIVNSSGIDIIWRDQAQSGIFKYQISLLDAGQSIYDVDEEQLLDDEQSYYDEDDACKQFKNSICSISQGWLSQIQRKSINESQYWDKSENCYKTSIKGELISDQSQEEQHDQTFWLLCQLNQKCQKQNNREQPVETISDFQEDDNNHDDNQIIQQISARQINCRDLDAFQQQQLSIILQKVFKIQSTIGQGAITNGRYEQTPRTQNGFQSGQLGLSSINVKRQVLVYNSFNANGIQEVLKQFPNVVVQTQQTVNLVENLMQEESSDSDNLSARNSQLIDSFQSWGSNQNSQLNDSSDSASSQDIQQFVALQLMVLNENPIQESLSAYILSQSSLFCYPLAMMNQHSDLLAQLPDESNLQNTQNLIIAQIPMLHEKGQNVGLIQSQKNVMQNEKVSRDGYSDKSSSFVSKDNSYFSISNSFVSLGFSQVSQNSDAVKLHTAQSSDQDPQNKKLSTVQSSDQDPPDKKWKQK